MPGGGGGGGKKGGGSVQAPSIGIPSGLLQGLSSEQGLGRFGQQSLDTFAGLGNWAAGLATGGHNTNIGTFEAQGLQTGPSVTIGSGGDTALGHYTWNTTFDPQTGQITYTNEQTGGQFQDWVGGSRSAQWLSPQLIQQWTQMYNNRGQVASGPGGPVTSSNWYQSLPPSLQTAWNQIQSFHGLEKEANAFTAQEEAQAQQFLQQGQGFFNQGNQLYNQAPGFFNQANNFFNQGNAIYNQAGQYIGQGNQLFNEGQTLLSEATTGQGVFPSQAAYINQAVQAEQNQLSQQLAAEGLGSSTANAILRGEAAQQGAATAGQLIQGNISAAQQETNLAQQQYGIGQKQIGLAQVQYGVGEQEQQIGQNQISLAENMYNIGQASQKLALGAQGLALGGQQLNAAEHQAMVGLAQGFQAQNWQEAMQAYGTLGQMMSTTGQLYGIDVSGYSNILQAEISQGQLQLEAALGNAQASIGAMQSLGQGLGSIFGSQGLSGFLGGGAGAAAGGGGSLSSMMWGGPTIGSIMGGGGAAAGAGGGIGGLIGSIGSGIGTVGSTILGALGAIFAL